MSPTDVAADRRAAPRAAEPLGVQACEQFLLHEARLLDEGRFDEWLALFTPDAWYWVPAEPDPIIMPRNSEGLYLLQRVRDEAHRFAITYHRSKRSKRMTASLLDSVPGLGEHRRKALVTHFGSIARLKEATVDQITAVPGIGVATATAVLEALRPDSPGATE